MLLASRFTSSIDSSLNTVKKFRSRDGGDNRLAVGKLPEEANQIKSAPFVCNETRTGQH
jgi:hypothetical protein